MRQPSDEGAPIPPRRRHNKELVRERVYAAALALFSRQGYADTSVAEIAEHAGIGRGTFFNYFPRKDCLLNAWTQERMRELTHRLAHRSPSAASTAETLRACMSALSDLNEEEPELSAAMLTAWIQGGRLVTPRRPLSAILAGIIEEGRTRGEIRSSADPELVAESLRDLYIGALYRWTRPTADRRHGRLDTELQLAVSLLLHGLAPAAPPPRD
ncbi:MAG: TetR/AcrR family transcriptional regulator [Streptomyces sp.]|nr:TetR/AcrR family transcriptional regulator [Streptomyces sp.]